MTIVYLVRDTDDEELYEYYLKDSSIDLDEVSVAYFPRTKGTKQSDKMDFIKDFLEENPTATTIFVANSDFFKILAGKESSEDYVGYVCKCSLKPEIDIIYVPSIHSLKRDPYLYREQVRQANEAFINRQLGVYEDPGSNVIWESLYPKSVSEIESVLDSLQQYDVLCCDIETNDLKFYKAGLCTISFAWDKHRGTAFEIDLNKEPRKVREVLKEFFISYKGSLVFHNAAYDVTVLIYELFMNDLGDQQGILEGLKVFSNIEDTKLISYLALNSTAKPSLSLKALSRPYLGKYGLDSEEIVNVSGMNRQELLEYNLKDTLGTYYVLEKYHPKMVQDEQEGFYREIFRPALLDVIQMQITGMPLDMREVLRLQNQLTLDLQEAEKTIRQFPLLVQAQHLMAQEWASKRNAKLKKKKVSYEDYPEDFNISSGNQLRVLLYDVAGLPILETTKSGEPSTGKEVLDSLINHTDDQGTKELLKAIIDYKNAEKILSAFIPHMLDAPKASDGWYYLFGNFNLGGTVSGRLSSSNINLQQLPSTGSKYAKAFKKCFSAPEGKLFVGLDFDSLEDKISALTSKDPEKIKIYTEGFDGHSYRAYHYWPDKFPDIDPNSVDSINSIADTHPKERQASKAPTFALTYRGTYITLMKNCGFSETEAKLIENNFHNLYKATDAWVDKQLERGYSDGYVIGAFGLKLRTPLMYQVVPGSSKTPKESEAEARTAGNFLGQSWCLLNSRAASEVMSQVRNSKYADKIRPCAQIHDAQYYIIDEDFETLQFLNNVILKAVAWQEHPDIQHDQVKMSGSLGIFFPNWSVETSLPKEINPDKVNALVEKTLSPKD